MRHHAYAEGLVRGHPALSELPAYLRSQQLTESTVGFLSRRAFFAYPRTLWLKLAVDEDDKSAADDMGFRHSLDPEKTSCVLGKWFAKSPATNNIVFDLTAVTIFDAPKMIVLFQATEPRPGGRKFYVAQGELADSLREMLKRSEDAIFPSEKELLSHLKDVPKTQRCVVTLPKKLDLLALDRALKKQAPDEKLRNCDVIAFDMSKVMSVSFRVHSMLSPIIHSLAHSHGVLATVWDARPKPKTPKIIAAHGSLRPMRSNLIQVEQDYLQRLDPPKGDVGILAMRTFFTKEESAQLQNLCWQRLDGMIRYYRSWFASVGKIPAGLCEGPADEFAEMLENLRNVINELIDNVINHSQGLGYM